MARLLGVLAALVLSVIAGPALAGVSVRVDLAAQRMQVTTTDGESYNWAISSGRKGFRSPNGVYRPTRLERSWYSRKYGGAMPYSVFFRGGYAIHGTTATGALGRPASHGCIRLHPANAAKLFALVKKHGAGSTTIALNGAANDSLSRFAKASSKKQSIAAAKVKQRGDVVQTRGAPGWEAARGQILLRPSLPAGAYGYQPAYGYPRSYGPGWR